MKLKSQPADFQVEELTDFRCADGPFAVYLLTKESLGTPEAVTAIERRWQLSRRAISYGGLKDKHAVTRQWLTIHRGPRRNLEQTHLSLMYQGQSPREFTPHDIAANRFRIVLRNLPEAQAQRILGLKDVLARDGVPNYFDDQRFGSLGHSGEFLAAPWCRGDYERTLWLAIAEPNPHDRPEDRAEKESLRTHWGDWLKCKAELPRSSRRSIVTFLCDHPTDFRRAVALLRQDLRSLYLAAFQSFLWNRIVADVLTERIDAARRFEVALDIARLPFFRELSDDERTALHGVTLPLPSARLHFEPDDPREALYSRVVRELAGVELRELRVKYPRDTFFSKGERAAVIVPQEFRAASGLDEMNARRHAVTLEFVLPRGAYATIVIKRLTGLLS
ncbi:MAG: tRNA pseudouridine(13) synthase TruD [Planctomycetaceae bacterium]|nr:tRNA pseudouridine(13) synthase TruD [Planctomycetaceae bacterium]